MTLPFVTTTFTIEGYAIREYKGLVRGIVVRSPTLVQGLLGSLKQIVGGRIGAYTEMCEQTREAAYNQMVEHALLLGANAIVGAQLPIAVGAALTAQVTGKRNIAITFFGEGAANIGAFHEALNLASVWKLPVLFICENNLYGEYSAMHLTTPVANIADRAAAYGMPGIIIDGQDVETVYHQVREVAERARAGGGPALIELKTYRFRGHSRTDQAPYRPAGELDRWLKRDPIVILKNKMIADGQLDETEFDELHGAIERTVHDAVEWKKAEPYPALDALTRDIYYEG